MLAGLLLAMTFVCCSLVGIKRNRPQLSVADQFARAIADAVFADENEIFDELIPIDFSNDYLTWTIEGQDTLLHVLNWTDHPERFSPGDSVVTWWGDTWVTVAPELVEWLAARDISANALQLRLEQLLGLPPDGSHTHVVHIRVNPKYLFRPSPDAEITDRVAELDLPSLADSCHVAWYHETIIDSYFPPAYPWTRLGYTYDWGDEANEIGLSEFVIRKNSTIHVIAKTPTLEFVTNNVKPARDKGTVSRN